MGSPYPSVTAILEAVGLGPDYSRVPNDGRMERASGRGTAGHKLVEAHFYGYLAEGEAAPPGYLAFLAESGWKPAACEFEVVSERWGFVGHPDQRGWLDARRGLLDFKFMESLGNRAPVQRQLAGYKLAREEQRPDQPIAFCAAVQFLSSGSYKLHPFTDDEMDVAKQEFLHALACHRARGRKT